MRYSGIVNTVATAWETDPHLPVYISGPPGTGKTSMAFDLARRLDIDPRPTTEGGSVMVFRPSLRDPVDLMGTPKNDGQFTHWVPPFGLGQLMKGRWVLVIDELPQGEKMMQNALAGLMLDRFIEELMLSPEVFVMATGNRTKDKAGANRIVSQLGNRVLHLEQTVNNADWVEWAMRQPDLDVMGIAFLRWRTEALFDFDPDKFSNATPRAWARLLRQPYERFGPEEFYEMACGIVGEKRAAEYIGFRKLLGRVPSLDQIKLDPQGTPVPTEPDVAYACMAHLIQKVAEDEKLMPLVMPYVERMREDYQVLFMKGVVRDNDKLMSTREFIQWSIDHKNVFL